MVGGVEIYTIPARREEDLGTKTLRACCVGKVVGLLCSFIIVDARKADGLASEVVSGGTLERVTSKHAETFREGMKCIVVGTWSLSVVLLVR